MNLFALLLGLALERLLTRLFHLREFDWLDPIFDSVFRTCRAFSAAACFGAVGGVTLFAVLPVVLLSILIDGVFFDLPQFAFSVVILLFSLGPRDLKQEVDELAAAATAGDADGVRRLSRQLLEAEPSAEPAVRDDQLERAIFVQANNRIFGVVFWFLLLGPAGAWAFRVLDLMRHRAVSPDTPPDLPASPMADAVQRVHGALAWIPAHLLSLTYAMAGSFEDAIGDWRVYYQNCAPRFFDITNDVLGCAGTGAVGRPAARAAMTTAARVSSALRLVVRTLWLFWCPVIALLTLNNLVQ